MVRLTVLLFSAILLASCGSGGRRTPSVDPAFEGAPILVTAGSEVIAPTTMDISGLDLARHQIDAAEVEAVFVLTTPASERFRFELATWGAEDAKLAIAHVETGNQIPESRVDRSLTESGFVFVAGRARIGLRGAVADSQVLAIRASGAGKTTVALVFVRIGPRSGINPPIETLAETTASVDRTLISSRRLAFGHPAVAVGPSGPVAVWYDGDSDVLSPQRYQLRMRAADRPVGGAVLQAGEHTLRADHDIAAGPDGLVIARATAGTLTLEFSPSDGSVFDSPASFFGPGTVRLPRVALAPPSRFAAVHWRDRDLVLLDGLTFTRARDRERVIHTAPAGALLLPASIAWTPGGDLVVAYAYSTVELRGGLLPGRVETTYRCYVLPDSGDPSSDVLVDRSPVLLCGPAVCIADATAQPRMLYVHAIGNGLAVRESTDGLSFSVPRILPVAGAREPRVFARQAEDALRVDVLYLRPTSRGGEIQRHSWEDFDFGAAVHSRVTRASMTWRETGPSWRQIIPFYTDGTLVREFGFEGFEVENAAYDAVQQNGKIHVLFGESKLEYFFRDATPGRTVNIRVKTDQFPPVLPLPPPTLPTLTEALSEPYWRDYYQLRLLVLDE
jgi:hypothetical protein